MKKHRVATKDVFIMVKFDENVAREIKLVKGKKVADSKLEFMTLDQIGEYTEEVEDTKVDISFLSSEDVKFYRKNKSHPDMEWALDIMAG
tara:strand:- start:1153 stop:1422 length:270 start_codon:yes stop_codon:yes gene_type:complete